MGNTDGPAMLATEDQIDSMQRKFARFLNPHMHLDCTPAAMARARADAEACMKQRDAVVVAQRREKRVGLDDLRSEKVERRLGDRRAKGREDEGP